MQTQLPKLLAAILFLTMAQFTYGQVTTVPGFPRGDQKVKIIYDASKGTTELSGVDPIYIHIGAILQNPTSTVWAIVPFQWGTANPNAKMTKVAGTANTWEWEMTPNDFFGTTADQKIYRLGLVFRNADGTKKGASETNSDIFIELSQGFQVAFTKPKALSVLLEIGDTQEIEIVASENAALTLSLDGDEVAAATNKDKLQYSFTAQSEGVFSILAKATQNQQSASEELLINVVGQSPQLPLPIGAKKGINYLSDSEVILALEAPNKKNVFVIGDFNDWQVLPQYQMNATPDGEIFWLKLNGLIPGQEYIFQYLVDGSIRIGDPYADKISDPFHDLEIINDNRYSGLKPFPSGKTEFQATYLQTAQTAYPWKYLDYKKPAVEELVIYELLIRDFDERRSYKAVTERLDYLVDLGINAIELMPVQEFEGNLSWGYNPAFFFAPDKYYGTKDELKTLIDEAHKRNIVVIMDMVLNHAFGQNPMVRLYNDGDYGAPTEENPWFNRTAKHPFNVGYDFNHESAYTKSFVDSVNNYWLTEYKVDGFRFDLSKGFTQVNSGNNVGFWGQKDESRIAIWKHIYDRIKGNHPDAYVILEHFADNVEERELAEHGLLLWGNINGDFREMAKGNSNNFNWAYFKTRGWANNNLISYMESHDEERTMWESLTYGQTSPLNIRNLSNAVNRNQLMSAFFFAIPGPKMLWQFEEFGYDQELNNDRLGVKPTKWEYLDNPDRQRLFNLYSAMALLKKELNLFNKPEEVLLDFNQALKSIQISDGDLQMLLYGNFGLTDIANASLSFPASGLWYNYFTGEEVSVLGSTKDMKLSANSFLLFTNKRLPIPKGEILVEDLITSLDQEIVDLSVFKLFPVPARDRLEVLVPSGFNQFNYRILDITGRILKEGVHFAATNILEVDIRDFRAGLYIFEINDNRQLLRKRFLKE
ncbi:hypothetical protein P872_24615 [Rhodonellum psychrophilum GCM71 = DSM 17998]|uniref:Glycosyl hydrolase family 13 catalytic domain-containing protein n=2 Tax=Rhodonellum TaxID=336827 RepID=U5C462_9BACT|nr:MULTISPECIES: alpha-amylase family glycosyl hydrolase [Rhodonellum]ERM84604.1 hypothetical protein P872_24615 [Rhodonellum psychrophilum GCM71 = DSM 17998]